MRKERIWVKPSPPKPDQLQLTTNARSLTRSEFLGAGYTDPDCSIIYEIVR